MFTNKTTKPIAKPAVTPGPSAFDRFGLDPVLLRGVAATGFTTPRTIQVEAMPAALAGRDVLGLAQTGTGKTAAFALPLLQRLLHERRTGPGALVLAPTRELATQIAEEIRALARYTRLEVITIFGGVPTSGQVRGLRRRPAIVVGCPGRVLDLLGQGVLTLDQVGTLVLDEADHMFDMGFLADIRAILAALPARRQNLMYSATMPREVRRLADEILRDPHVVEQATSAPAATIDHSLVLVGEKQKRNLLEILLREKGCESAIVFTSTKRRAKQLADQLGESGHRAVAIQGNLSQARRDRAMQGFRSRHFNILVATDIVARGIDVSGVSHVINFDVPNTPEAYTHRIGRTGRAELEGTALTFVTGNDHGWLRATERMIGARIERRLVDGFTAEPEGRSESRRGAYPVYATGGFGGRSRGTRPYGQRPQGEGRRRPRRGA
ncbi:MAG: DEAD/DEAH box helicase [Krumholzibacteria bacterium]|nr:DEAD/DEAH box helicase [Candidatus Krumholzibacteria bacterium]